MQCWTKKAFNDIQHPRGYVMFGSTPSDVMVMEQGGPKKMKFKDIKFNNTIRPEGIQALVMFKDYELSIIKNEASYGNAQGLYEIAVFKDNEQTELPGITEEGDTVKGFLTESDVEGIIKKMHLISGTDPKTTEYPVDTKDTQGTRMDDSYYYFRKESN